MHCRYGNFEDFLKRMDEVEGGIDKMSRGYDYFGAHVEPDNTFVMRQWAPAAQVRQYSKLFLNHFNQGLGTSLRLGHF